MNDLIDEGGGVPGNAPEFTVSELSGAVKRTIEGAFSRVRVRGEVGRVSRPRSGHVYLDLKDDRAVLAAVIWKGVAARLAVQPEEGLEVIATGKLTTYPGQSKYQLVIERIEPAGAGALMAMLEARRRKLAAEGLFDPARKKPLPFLPEVIGVVTSPSGAVIRDILHRLRDRFPRQVVIWPVAVQGEACAPEVARAIAGFNALPARGGPVPRPDLIIVARGGGSVEDLWGFNDEAVVRAAAASEIPLISAVGHETDTTLIDYAADMRAPTPTAAAELAVPVRLELVARLRTLGDRAVRAVAERLAARAQRLRDLARALPRPEELTARPAQRVDTAALRLRAAMEGQITARQLRLARAAARLRPDAGLEAARRRLDRAALRLAPSLGRNLERHAQALARTAQRLRPEGIAERIATRRERLEARSERLARAAAQALARLSDRLAAAGRLLEGLGYRQTLARGFAVVRAGGQVITSAAKAARAPAVEVEFADGRTPMRPLGPGPTRPVSPPRKPGPRDEGGPDQGSLF